MRRRFCLLVVVLAGGCILPTDHASDLRLTFETLPLVYLGDTTRLNFHALDSATGRVIRPEDIVLVSSDPSVLAVAVTDRTSAIAVANKAGVDTITLRLRSAAAPAAVQVITVLDTLIITSVQTATGPLYPGDTATIHGIGLDTTRTSVTIGGLPATLVAFAPDIPGRVGGPGHLVVLVPAAASPAQLTVRRGRRSASSPDLLPVVPSDRLEPNDAAPHTLGTLGAVIRYPFLVLEGTNAGNPAPRDWYTFTNPDAQDVTFVLKPDRASTVDDVTLWYTDTLDASGSPRPQGWMESVAGNYCRGTVVGGYHGVLDSQIVAVAALPAGTYHVMVRAAVPSPVSRGYELRIERGYQSVLPRDLDRVIGGSFSQGNRSGNCTRPDGTYFFVQSSSKTIDNVGAVAWYSFPLDAGPILYQFNLLNIPSGQVSVLGPTGTLFGQGGAPGTTMTLCLAPGTYALGVSGTAGNIGNYALTVHGVPTAVCVPPLAPPGAR